VADAGNQTEFNGVASDSENDRNSGCRRLGGKCRGFATSCYEHRHAAANQIGRQFWQTIILTLGPAVFNRNILAFDMAAACLQASAERSY
jgi:hypothetical protein